MKRIAAFPTILTLSNAFCGFLAIGYVMRAERSVPEKFGHNMEMAGWMVLLALVFDALDGKIARLMKSETDFGVQLDSLADVISFGVAPGFMCMAMVAERGFLARLGWAASSLFMICALLRLARYNVETQNNSEGSMYFTGLPAPAGAGLVASLVMMRYHIEIAASEEFGWVPRRLFPMMDALAKYLPFLALALALLMVSRVRYVHVVNKWFGDQEPFGYVVLLILVGFFFFFTRPFSIPLAFLIYIAAGLAGGFRETRRENNGAAQKTPQ